ncbi:MAG: ATP-binding protein [Cyanobacteriota bacterium]
MQELLENACKFTQPGGTLCLEARLIPSGLELKVGNTAQIPAIELPHLFDRFYRVPSADPWVQQGIGLGLALVKQWVEYLQGQIQVTSQAGWTWFILRLPNLELPDSTPNPPQTSS